MELSGTENCIVPLCTWLDYHEIRMAVFRLRSQPCTQLRTFQGHWATGHWLLWTDANGRACGTGLRSALYPSHVLCMCAKLLQSCLTLCDPMDCSPPGFSVHGASPGEKAGMGCHALLQWILPTKGLNPWLLHYRWILYHWAIRKPMCYSFQALSRVWLFVIHGMLHTRPPCPSPTPEAAQTHVLWVSDAIQPSHPLHPLLLLPLIFLRIRVFPNESRIRWPKYWGFNFSISPSNEYSGLISFGIDWFRLLAVKGTLKNLIQHHSSKASILQCSAFFMVQLSHPHMTTWNVIALTRQTLVAK